LFKKIIFIITLIGNFNYVVAKERTIHPAVKSILMPGWGESSLSKSSQSRFFNLIELTLWSTCLGFYKFSNHQKLQYQSYAAKYAGTNHKNKSHNYWVDIGNYLSLETHNAEHLRWRQIDDIYDAQYDWNWKSLKHMEKFEEMRIRSDKLSKYGEYTIGVITLNHIISSINSLYLSRLNNNLKFYSFIKDSEIKIQLRYDL
tara:strand:- start:131 stop:733 length:603 start_codon:yes stop_codon:yes gene_type:complete